MNKLKSHLSKAVIIMMIVLLTSCYGSFNLTKKLYNWNGTVGDKFINTLVFYGLIIVPVYEIATLADFVVFNTIEFWSGKNPVTMAEGESETKIVKGESDDFEITAVQNKFIIKNLSSGEITELVFNHEEQAWFVNDDGKSFKLVQLVSEENEMVEVSLPNGETLSFNPESVTEKDVVRQSIQSSILSD